ncbi:MAG: excinuclease ABC subunit UvrC [Acidimicrobiia bacterium]|nr:excinuclease ABC subunit UvrC [Acidimicrobiia bacterium]
MVQRPLPSEIPDLPGAYLFRNRHGEVMYAGKAKSLRKRVSSYFSKTLAVRTAAMVDASETVEWIVTENEVEALMLEYTLIQKHKPRFNIRLRDDKSYPFLAITRQDEWPRAMVMRGKRKAGTQYFGPYGHAYAIRQTLDLLLRTFPVRTCTDSKYGRHESSGRPCLLFHIERCSGPCVGEVTPEAYQEHVDGLASFLAGDHDDVVARLTTEMMGASERQEYEHAARLRDQMNAVHKASARQEMVTKRPENFDLLALADDELEASVALLTVRRGRVVGRVSTIVDKVEDVTTAELIGTMIELLYGSEVPPGLILVPELPDDHELLAAWLATRREGRVEVRVPERGAKRRLLETARANAVDEFARHRMRRNADHNARAKALRSLQDALDLPDPPLRIECYDISTVQGTNTVGSMVVLEDGLPRPSDYRHFRVRDVAGQDDFASMEEVLRRRFTAYLKERDLPPDKRGRFAYPPSLILVDGGAGQLSRAVQVLDELDLDIPVAGLAKRMEEVYLPGRAETVRIPRGEEALYLLQRVRDEAHRFAITYHRKLRGKRMVDSILDDVPGVGATRKKALLREFGSLKRLREASIDQIGEVVPRNVASSVYEALHGLVGSSPRRRHDEN